MRRNDLPERLPEREIGRRLLAIYELLGWPIPDEPQKRDAPKAEQQQSDDGRK